MEISPVVDALYKFCDRSTIRTTYFSQKFARGLNVCPNFICAKDIFRYTIKRRTPTLTRLLIHAKARNGLLDSQRRSSWKRSFAFRNNFYERASSCRGEIKWKCNEQASCTKRGSYNHRALLRDSMHGRETTRLILVPERIEENGMGFEGGSLILGIQS